MCSWNLLCSSRQLGMWGSMAEYLRNTVEHLEELGIHDRQLWRLQELVAEQIEAATTSALPEERAISSTDNPWQRSRWAPS